MPQTLAEFIEDDMINRGMESQREYARFVGCAPSTIGEYLNGAEPTIDFLRKLANATGVSLRLLMDLSYPESRNPDDVSPDMLLMVRQFSNLPKSVQDFILTAVRSMKGGSGSHHKAK